MLTNKFKSIAGRELIKKLKITPYYQPIFNIKLNYPIGFEALSRFTLDGEQISPIKVFKMADDFGVSHELDTLCREEAVKNFPKDINGFLFLNIFPSYLTSEYFGKRKTLELIIENGLEPSRVVLELTEAEKVQDIKLLKKAVDYYKELGFIVGIDDVGTGYNSLQIILEMEGLLDFVKLPRELVNGFSRSKIKYQLLKVLTEVSLNIGAKPIYEGVEQEEDAELLHSDIDAQYVQGFYFCKPVASENLKNISSIQTLRSIHTSLPTRGEIPEYITLGPDFKFGKFLDVVEKLSRRYVIVNMHAIDYLVDLWKLKYSVGEVEKNLYYYKPLSEISKKFNSCFYTIDELPRLTPDSFKNSKLLDFLLSLEKDILICRENNKIQVFEKYHLLNFLYKKISEELLNKNPLTQLPGNNALRDKVRELCNVNKEFYLCYIDIDNFKAFNDTYGFYAGDQMLKKVGVILSIFESKRKEKVFVCHIGGDDFAIVIWDIPVEDMLQELLQLLSDLHESLLEFYSPEDKERGYFIGTDRNGAQKDFPIASISMALVNGSSDIVELSKRSAQLKRKAKAYRGSALAVEFLNEILTINL